MPLEPPIAFPAVRPGDDIVLSASSFVTFTRCPEQAAGRLRGVYGPESRQSFVGGLAHRIFARHLTDGEIGADELNAVCRQEIGAGMNPKLGSLGLKPSELGEVIDEVGRLYERFKTMKAEGFVGAEEFLDVEPAPGVKLRGSVDAVFEEGSGVRLVDWKTGNLGDPGPQLAFYALVWAMERDEMPARVEAVSISTGERTDSVPSRSQLEETATAVGHAVDVLRTAWESDASLERRAGPWCRWCPLLDDCSEGRATVELLSR